MFCFLCSSTFWHNCLCIHICIQKARSFIQLYLSQVVNSCSLFLRPWYTYSLDLYCSLHQVCLFTSNPLITDGFLLNLNTAKSATALTCELLKDKGSFSISYQKSHLWLILYDRKTIGSNFTSSFPVLSAGINRLPLCYILSAQQHYPWQLYTSRD